MKIKRYKKFQNHVKFFTKHFDWKPPFNLLLDGTFAKVALDNKVNLRDQLPKYFDNPVKLFTTPCCLVETEKLGPDVYGALQVLKTFQIHKCPHAEAPTAAVKCIQFMAKQEHEQKLAKIKPKRKEERSKSGTDESMSMSKTGDLSFCTKSDADKYNEVEAIRFIPGTQDATLRKYLRQFPGIPLIYMNGPAPAFERPSQTTQVSAHQKSVKKLEVLNYQKEILNNLKEEAFGNSQPPERKGTKKRKRAGPNPLSCRKSNKRKDTPEKNRKNPLETETKKKRKRVRLPKHVKQELAKHQKST